MGQITIAFAEQMLVHAERLEHSPLTVHEEEQLARRWLESERLRDRCAESLRFYGALKAELVRLARCQPVEAELTRGQIADLLILCTREIRGMNELYERMRGLAKG